MHALSITSPPAPRGPTRRGATLADLRASATAYSAAGQQDEAIEFLLAAYGAIADRTEALERLVEQLKRRGRRSERLDHQQLTLLLEQLLGGEHPDTVLQAVEEELSSRADALLDAEIAAAEAAAPIVVPPRALRQAWKSSAAVTHTIVEHDVLAPARACPTCGEAQQHIGEDITHTLEYVPGHFVEHEHRCAKYACGRCKQGVTTASGPVRILPRSAAEASVLADLVVSKYADHCPLHRLHRIYDRSGVALPVSTMADWVAGVGELVTPLVDRLRVRMLTATIVRTDATGLRVLGNGDQDLGTMWCYVGDDRDVVFDFTPTGEGASGPWTVLAGRTGYVQADAATVFDRLYAGHRQAVAAAIEVGCWAHARRRFVALEDTDGRVAYPLKLIARLYRVEHLADAQGLSPPARAVLRSERSPLVLDKLARWLAATHTAEPPSSALAQAVGYVLNQWTALTRFVADGRLALDNNLCEQQLRTIALGRKNYLFAGSPAAATRAARLYSLLRSAAQHGAEPLAYLTAILPVLAGGATGDALDALLPDRWLVARAPTLV